MNGFTVKPKRRLLSEIFMISSVVIFPVLLISAMPSGLIGYHFSNPSDSESRAACSIVVLTPEQERAALVEARASWQSGLSDVKGMRADLSVREIPDAPMRPVISERKRIRTCRPVSAEFEPTLLPEGLAAGRPADLTSAVPTDTKPTPAFSRTELLKID